MIVTPSLACQRDCEVSSATVGTPSNLSQPSMLCFLPATGFDDLCRFGVIDVF